MKIYRRYPFSLIEVLIATGVASILISIIIFGFTNILKTKRKIESTTQVVLQRKLLQERLTQIFSAIVSENPQFTCENAKLCFCFNHGVDHDPDFSGIVNATIYHDKDSLKLDLTSLKDNHLQRTEVLIDHVSNIRWTFIRPDKEKTPIAIRLDVSFDDDHHVPFAFFPTLPLNPIPAKS